MELTPVAVFDMLSPEAFRRDYYEPKRPVVVRDWARQWPAYEKWNWDFLIQQVGEVEVGLYNNVKSDAYTPINTADAYMKFADYLRLVKQGPVELRVFLFNLFEHVPQLAQDFTWPEHLMRGFVRKYPMLFVGGEGSVTHMHFDIDLSHILHTQFMGRKRVLLFPFEEQHKLYRKPYEVLSMANFERYYEEGRLDTGSFPALQHATGYEVTLQHGDTLFMPAGYWHHMEYLDSGFAMSLRALQSSLFGKLHGVWNLFGMRGIDTFLKKTTPERWYNYKKRQVYANAEAVLSRKHP